MKARVRKATNCLICGEPLHGDPKRLYCSKPCQERARIRARQEAKNRPLPPPVPGDPESWKAPRLAQNCGACGAQLTGHCLQKYCNAVCREKFYRQRRQTLQADQLREQAQSGGEPARARFPVGLQFAYHDNRGIRTVTLIHLRDSPDGQRIVYETTREQRGQTIREWFSDSQIAESLPPTALQDYPA